jgi:hypothetical protein
MILFLRFAIPFLILNYKMWNMDPDAEVPTDRTDKRRRTKRMFIFMAAGIVLSGFNSSSLFSLLSAIMIPVVLMFVPIILRGYIWQEETVDGEEGSG